MPARVTSDAFIGRRVELTQLDAALSHARTGHSGMVFVAGESGVGKTRLLDHFADHAEREAAAFYERALELWDRVDGAGSLVGMDHAALLARAANAHQFDFGRCIVLIKKALGELDQDAEPGLGPVRRRPRDGRRGAGGRRRGRLAPGPDAR
jgi:predicted ATPase